MAEFFDSYIEKQTLSGALQNDTDLEFVINSLAINDFYIETHQYLYNIICRFHHKFFKPINREILAKWLVKYDLKRKSEILILFGEIKALPVDEYLKFYVDELNRLSAKRRLYRVYKKIQEGLESDSEPIEIFSTITTDILKGDSTTNISRTWIFDDPEIRIKQYIDKRDYPEKYCGTLYGIKSLDEITGGMFRQQLYLIFGRTGSGKSRFLFNIGSNAAKAGKKVMYCTIEMPKDMLQHMWESREAKIPLDHILKQQMTPEDEAKYFKFLREQADIKHPFYVVDIPQGATTGIIESEINMFKKIHGKSPDIVLIDYANLIEPVSRYRDRTEKYDHVFRELKEAARGHNTIYYTAAQANREVLKARKAGTEHIAFSDASSHHCDAIFNIFSDDKDEVNHEVHLEVIKGRYHKKGKMSLSWDRDTNHIRDWDDLIKRPVHATTYPNATQSSGQQSIPSGQSADAAVDETSEY